MIGAGERSEQDELPIEAGLSKVPQEVDARHILHLDVGNDEIEFVCSDERDAFGTAGGACDAVAFLLQEDFEQFADRPLVVHDENFGSLRH